MVFDSEPFRPVIPIASEKRAIIPELCINELLMACFCFAVSGKCPLLLFSCSGFWLNILNIFSYTLKGGALTIISSASTTLCRPYLRYVKAPSALPCPGCQPNQQTMIRTRCTRGASDARSFENFQTLTGKARAYLYVSLVVSIKYLTWGSVCCATVNCYQVIGLLFSILRVYFSIHYLSVTSICYPCRTRPIISY